MNIFLMQLQICIFLLLFYSTKNSYHFYKTNPSVILQYEYPFIDSLTDLIFSVFPDYLSLLTNGYSLIDEILIVNSTRLWF